MNRIKTIIAALCCREEPWRVIAYKRKMIRAHYETLGYSVLGAGFDEDGNYDSFLIGW